MSSIFLSRAGKVLLTLTTTTRQRSGSGLVRTFTSFQDLLTSRRAQAKKSVLIQLPNQESAGEVRHHLQTCFGPLQILFRYSVPEKAKGGKLAAHNHWLLAEFSSAESATECLKSCDHAEGTLPFNSAMCFYQNHHSTGNSSNKEKSKKKTIDDCNSNDNELPEIVEERLSGAENLSGENTPNYKAGKTLSDQLYILQDSTKLSEFGIRIRFFIAGQLEQALSSLFPHSCILPFGSTVSGIGRQSGDLDLVLVPDSREVFPNQEEQGAQSGTGSLQRGKLFYQSKLFSAANSSNARFQAQRVMETMADVIQLFIPGCLHVQRILQARVPILRFWSDFTDLQCDLSMTNSSGVHMSELIYLMCKLEPRFPTLLFTVRAWAAGRKITNPVPGRQPTNFMLVLLLIYYLQQKQLLPTFDILFNNAGIQDQRITADGIDCTFLRNQVQILRHFTSRPKSEESLAELLFDFFEFYSDFDFNTKGVSVVTGNSWGKPDASPLYIQNPLERHLNVARNVSKEEVTRFKSECCSALWKLETSWNENDTHHSQSNSSDSDETSSANATLQSLLLGPLLNHSHSQSFAQLNQQRLQVKELFTKS